MTPPAAHPWESPITVFGGEGDPRTSREGLEAWRRQTSDGFWLKRFPGGHFFLNKDAGGDQLLETLSATLAARFQGVV